MRGIGENMDKKKRYHNVVFDFDGVINSYLSGFEGATIISDEPVNGIKEEIARIREEYKVVVVSTRCYKDGGIEAIKEWLDKHGIVVDDVTSEKPPAIVTIDDRAIVFDGESDGLLEKIKKFQPWYRSKAEELYEKKVEYEAIVHRERVEHWNNK